MADNGQAKEQEEHNLTEATLPYHQTSSSEQLEKPQPGEQDNNIGVQTAEEQVEPFLQHKFLEALTSLEQGLLPPARDIEVQVKMLQDEADTAEAKALQVKQQMEERLMNLAYRVDNFHQEIQQVLPVLPHKRSWEEMERNAAGQQGGTP